MQPNTIKEMSFLYTLIQVNLEEPRKVSFKTILRRKASTPSVPKGPCFRAF